jgi:exosome complex exonuclease DIS3/RRP44
VVVHRLLAAVLGLSPLPEAQRNREALAGCAANLNTRHHNAQMAGRSSVELYTVFFFKDRRLVADARVTKVGGCGVTLTRV